MLVVLIDALGNEFVSESATPFLAALRTEAHAGPLGTILGYSSAIRATAFSGVLPSVHGIWSKYRMDPSGSQFGNVESLRVIDRIPVDAVRRLVRIGLSKTILDRILDAPRGSHLSLENVPIGLLPQFRFSPDDIIEHRTLPVATIFDVLDAHSVSWCYQTIPFMPHGFTPRRIEHALQRNQAVFVYIGGLDFAGHRWGPNTMMFTRTLRRIDRFVESVFAHAARNWGSEHEFLVFSDHGMERVTEYVHPSTFLERLERSSLVPSCAFFDSTMARLWGFDTETAVGSESEGLKSIGRFLTESERSAVGIDFADTSYGEVIFLLEPGRVFHPSYVSWAKPVGMHGYDPGRTSQDGILVSSSGCGRSEPHRHKVAEVKTFIERSVVQDG